MSKVEDGNRQDMSVHDVEHPSLSATEEAQDVASLNRIVVGMPAFTDPHNPMTQSGSVNLPLDQHPVTHSADYGDNVTPGVHVFTEEHSPMAVGAATLTDGDAKSLDAPQDREEWNKSHWQSAAKEYGLPTSGNTDTIRERVESHESDEEAVGTRSKELHSMSRDDLDNLADDYNIDPAEHSNKESLADAILTAERESN